jgi:S-DNA-T family DNA segregation ATPase FtsK/SpoIIIE
MLAKHNVKILLLGMGRKKKQEIEEEKKVKKIVIHSDVKRSIAAIFLFALAIVSVLGFFEKAGILGIYINKIFGFAFGWGKWVSPLVLITAGIILLFRKSSAYYIAKLLGLAIAFLSILGFFHLYFKPDKLFEMAKAGSGGGYAGYILSLTLLKLTGVAAGTIILAALFIIGMIVAFNFSVITIFEKLFNLGKKAEEIEAAPEEVAEEKPEEYDEKNNIKSIQFVEGPEEKESGQVTSVDEKKPWLSRKKKEFSSHPLDHSWQFPPLDLLEISRETAKGGDVEKNAQLIQRTLSHFGIEVELGGIQTGPTVTQYSFRPAVGVKLSKITALNNDLALALAAHPIRIEAPIPGKSLVGIEVPNKIKATVRLRNILQSEEFQKRKSNLMLALGEDVSGNYIFGDLEKMPHLMIAGSTGSGKSVCINSILLSLLYQNSPEDLQMILVDPKRVELSLYNDIPHLKSGVIVENGKVVGALKWAIGEMERRYRLMQDTGSRDIASFNQRVIEGKKRTYTNPETGEKTEEDLQKLPFILIVIDELADLMQAHGKEVEGAIIRIAQMARAVGIHLIVSTQRPSVEIITGLIKANITTRIAFQVATQIDSRTILDIGGAEKLLGNGDMLYLSANTSKPRRLQGVLASEDEVKKVVKFVKRQREKKGNESEDKEDITNPFTVSGKIDFDSFAHSDQEDSLYEEAKRIVVESRKASSSLLQRRLRVGYARAARLIDMLEENGVISSSDGTNKPREILASTHERVQYEDEIDDQKERDKWQI